MHIIGGSLSNDPRSTPEGVVQRNGPGLDFCTSHMICCTVVLLQKMCLLLIYIHIYIYIYYVYCVCSSICLAHSPMARLAEQRKQTVTRSDRQAVRQPRQLARQPNIPTVGVSVRQTDGQTVPQTHSQTDSHAVRHIRNVRVSIVRQSDSLAVRQFSIVRQFTIVRQFDNLTDGHSDRQSDR